MGSTIIEKIIARSTGREVVTPNERVWVDVDLAVVRDFGGPNVILEYEKDFGDQKVHDPDKIAITFDLHVPAKDEKVAQNQKICRDFAMKQGIKNLFDVGSGIGQHVLLENGLVNAGDVIVGTDSHMNLLGCANSFSSGVGTTDIVATWAQGKLWFKVPRTIKISLEGNLEKPTSAKDVILHILKNVGCEGALYRSVEICGPTLENMSLSERITLTSMVTEMSGKAAFTPPHRKVMDFLERRTKKEQDAIFPDEDAQYVEEFDFEVGNLEPQIACPDSPDNVKPVSEVEGTPIDEVFIGSCTNGRYEDLYEAAQILKKNKVADGVRLIVLPSTAEVARAALDNGLYQIFFEAGAVVPNPSCGLCTTGHHGILARGEVLVSTSNRNFPGKVGKGGKVYLASPATAAASSIKGKITSPGGL
ncbi:MAG: homoaconitate hydratase family protein [Methanomassiliicoccales archaeon]|nr:MAG: homoaconitate hydratase family protein [Methanomassiliicoccales archaeon]